VILYLYDELQPRDFLNRMNGIFAFVLYDPKRETFLIARASRYWPHGHVDAGSFFMYWRDRPLITEAGRGINERDRGSDRP
jgi:hypothetical protein